MWAAACTARLCPRCSVTQTPCWEPYSEETSLLSGTHTETTSLTAMACCFGECIYIYILQICLKGLHVQHMILSIHRAPIWIRKNSTKINPFNCEKNGRFAVLGRTDRNAYFFNFKWTGKSRKLPNPTKVLLRLMKV